MAITNRERVGKALEVLQMELAPFVERELEGVYKNRFRDEAVRLTGNSFLAKKSVREWDVAALFKVMWESWNEVFGRILGQEERNLVSELWNFRNKWAHQEGFSIDDVYRVLDSGVRLLEAISSPQVEKLRTMRMEILRARFEEELRNEKRKMGVPLVEAASSGALPSWRDVVEPHPDVAGGNYLQAEFAADLWQVYRGEASVEYQDPVEFFRRTYLTESLKRLLQNAVKRLKGTGGEPVVQLQTNFGGGKTHSMIALYHLFSGANASELPGVEALMAEVGEQELPRVHRVVIVGNRISPGNPMVKEDGTVVRTLWGEIAWQLGYAKGGVKEARKAYELIAADDERATNPGERLQELLKRYGPCLILVDEWVAYARQLHDEVLLPGGTFDTQFTFAQALTESARTVRGCLLVVSLPASDQPISPHAQVESIEVGGIRGREALERLRNVIGRIESTWRPATAEESFEIVRRRLFRSMQSPEQFKARDLVVRAFMDFYRSQKGDFPPECYEAEYEQKMRAAYPIHPEVFARLYEDWSTLNRFQRTRGVLRLMAAVVHALWERGDKSPLILPSTIPMDDAQVQFELTRYLSENWAPIIEKEVDGPESLPVRLDSGQPNFGRYQATRRVARTIYLGSAPLQGLSQRGIEDRRIRLGCVTPGESSAVFGDALRRLTAQATYLYQDGTRYWYSTQPNVTSEAEARAENLKREPEKVVREIERRIREHLRERNSFNKIHAFPQESTDIPDEPEARLVILSVATPHSKGEVSPARLKAQEILEKRGSNPRIYRNTLIFAAVDRTRLQDLDEAVRRYLAWQSILDDREILNLSPQAVRQAEEQKRSANLAVEARLPEAFQWVLVPTQNDPQGEITWQEIRLQGTGALSQRIARRLESEEILLTVLSGVRLRMELDRVPLWRGNHVEIRQLLEDFARYLYLYRLRDASVLVAAIQDGVGLLTWEKDGFAYADNFDTATGRYQGLRVAQKISLSPEAPRGLLVKPEVAIKQLEEERQSAAVSQGTTPDPKGELVLTAPSGKITPPPEKRPEEKPVFCRFHGSVLLDSTRAGRDAGRIAEEVIAHLSGLPGATVRVTLEIEAHIPKGVPENVIRVVTENCCTLKFTHHGFERE